MKAGAGHSSSLFWYVRAVLALAVLIAARSDTASAQNADAPKFQEQTAIVVAFITDTAGRPIAGAEVQVVGTSLRGNTDDDGRIALLAVPAGNAVLRVRRLGFAERTIPISITPGVMPEVRYKLRPVSVELSKVVVRSSELKPDRYAKTGKFDGFYRRRAAGLGTFLTREIVDGRNAQRPEDLLRLVTGIRITYRGSTPLISFARCQQVSVYIDGILSHDGFRDFFALSPLQIEAMEVYHGMAQVPPEFSPHPNDCAAIVIWTRWNGGS